MRTEPGEALPEFTVAQVSPEAMKDWAVFLHDPNPIHLDVEAVRAKGLGDRVINQGPTNVAYIMNMLLAAFPGARLDALESRFVDNVYGGDRVVAGGAVQRVEEGRVHCDVWLRADGERPVMTGSAILSLPLST